MDVPARIAPDLTPVAGVDFGGPGAAPSSGTAAVGGEARRPLVLVADDEPAITALVAEMLGFSGFRVAQAHGGGEAISAARMDRPDLILLDVMMPDLDGRDACRVLKMDRSLRGIPVLLFSSADERDVHWRDAGADGFLQKPFSIRSLPGVVRGHLGARAGQPQA